MINSIQGFTDFIIFFDNQHVQRFCTNFNVSSSISGQPSQATVTLLYDDAFTQIEQLTDVRIFNKNIFSGKYVLIFSGQVYGRTINFSSGDKTITFSCQDYLAWMQKLPVPVVFGINQYMEPLTAFQWVSRGINFSNVRSVLTLSDQTFAGKTLGQLIATMFGVVRKAFGNITDSDAGMLDGTIYDWLDVEKLIRVVSDLYGSARDNNPIDIITSGAIVDNMYIFINEIAQRTDFELFQDRDELIKIKEHFYNEAILTDHIIDPLLVTNFTDSYDWSRKYTRVLAVGGLETAFLQSNPDPLAVQTLTPAGTYVGESGVFTTSSNVFPTTGSDSSTAATPKVAKTQYPSDFNKSKFLMSASSVIGTRYKLGYKDPSIALDCSGLVTWAIRNAGVEFPDIMAKGLKATAYPLTANQLQPGDLGFKFGVDKVTGVRDVDHVGIFVGVTTDDPPRYRWLEAGTYMPNGAGSGVAINTWANINQSGENGNGAHVWEAYGDIISAIQAGRQAVTTPIPISTEQLKLVAMSDNEKRFGVNILEVQQPYIRIPLYSETIGNTQHAAYTMLARYTQYLYNSINANTNNAALSMISAPWLRLGQNLWFDPVGVSRVYYITAINHTGGPQGITTSVSLSDGRTKEDYITNFKPKASQNPFIETTTSYPSDYFVGKEIQSFVSGTTNNMSTFQAYFEALKASAQPGENAETSVLHRIYGTEKARNEGKDLNYWDQEFTLYELYHILEIKYGGTVTSTVRNMAITGVLNPTTSKEKLFLSTTTKKFISNMGTPPAIIKTRKLKLAKIIAAADVNLKSNYIKSDFKY